MARAPAQIIAGVFAATSPATAERAAEALSLICPPPASRTDLASAIADELLRFAERLGAARVIAFLVGGSGPIERRIGLHHLVGLRLAAARRLRAPLRDLRRRRLALLLRAHVLRRGRTTLRGRVHRDGGVGLGRLTGARRLSRVARHVRDGRR